ncbi:MAG: ParB/RepB/Spo0J family partition protein [Lachnospiraceae bacterium]|nr:ParB/RepB/Spo0J family partition protein [Lachnospiraceae bacterium]MBR2702575.1 ParB/RepB/Spo0J family partition protein [Oscillospiraceae bacterium]
MPRKGANISLSSYDDIFETDESRADSQLEKVQKIPISELVPFKNHPFKVVDDEAMLRTTESIAQFGVLTPLIARPLEDGGYEIISGHRRAHAAEAAGLTEVPVIVRDMDDDAATVLMVDSNLQRESILPSERAFAYKMKLEAMNHQGSRTDLQQAGTSTQVVPRLRSNEELGAQNNQSRETVRRFIRLTNLIPELLDMVDQKQISFNPAVELSYLTPEEQQHVIEAMDFTQAAPSLSQAQRLKKLSQEGGCTLEAMQEILGEVKKGDLERVAFKSEQLRKYFPKSYSPKQMQDTIIKLLEQWQKKRLRDQER